MPGPIIGAECECGWTSGESGELRTGSSLSEDGSFKRWVMVYENGDLHTVDADYAKFKKLEVIEDPFRSGRGDTKGRTYRCPSCGRNSLRLSELGLWD